MSRTMYDKIWDAHCVRPETEDTPAILAIDLHLIHEVTSPQAFTDLRERRMPVRRPDRTVATMDHSTPTRTAGADGSLPILDTAAAQLSTLEHNCAEHGIELFAMGSDRRGIVHVIGPELGLTQPGMTIVCGDSHTSTHGAMGSLAFGIGTSEVAHALATQCVLQRKARTLSVECTGSLSAGVHAKDLILAIIQGLGVDGGVGHVIEYRGDAVRALSMDQRMTLCNMAIEAGARTGMVAPDETTFRYLHGRERSPQGADWEEARRRWESIVGDPDARFDKSFSIDASLVEPMITWGTTPAMAMPVGGRIPEGDIPGAGRALDYMGFSAGMGLEGLPIDQVFIGSCTNSRLSDLQDAAEILRGRTIHPNIACLVVPGSATVKRQAERLGLDRVFIDAGCDWREPGCSMCLGMNGDIARRGAYVVSTSNRNFEGRQGPGTRTMLASPATAAASAVRGCVTDPRTFIHEPVFIK